VKISRTGQRITHTSQYPVLIFAIEMLAVNRIVLKAYLDTIATDAFTVSTFEDGHPAEWTFARAERLVRPAGSTGEDVWRWGGTRPGHATMYRDADLKITAPFDLLVSDNGELVGWFDPTQDIVTIIDGYEDVSPLAFWQGERVSKPNFSTITIAAKSLVPMSDWVPLAATIMVPGDRNGNALPGPFPTILMRTPYGRNTSLHDAFKFVSRGYAVVAQDVRGRGDSEGFFNAIHEDIRDGDDTLNWIAAQPWSNGQIGMIGGSYSGWVQWQAASAANQHLKTMISIVPTFGAFDDLPYVNGMFCAGSLTWAVFMGSTQERVAEAMEKDLHAIASELPLIDADIRAVGHEIPFWRLWVTHDSMDGYWRQGDIRTHKESIDLPVLHVVGWYDDVLRGTMAAYGMMRENERANQQLLIGPWPHAVNTVRSLAELSFGPDSNRADMHFGYVRWFDRWLKGIDNGVEAEPAVRYFTMGENRWHESDNWPPKHCVPQKWFLHLDDTAAMQAERSLKQKEPSAGQPSCEFSHDPSNPVPYLVDIRANQLSVPEDYQEVERRPDVLTYTSDYLTDPLEITGEAVAVLYAATDQRDTDWVVRVTDVLPDGSSINIIDGYLRARFRNGMELEELVTPGDVVEYRIPMTWTSYRFAEGHRMRLIIASAAAGAFVVNTNTGNAVATDTEIRVANQTIYHSPRYPSHIELSIAQPFRPVQ
jgi:putative CocE/NonD family hydrolase